MRINFLNHFFHSAGLTLKAIALCCVFLLTISCGVDTDNEDLDVPEGLEDTSNLDSNSYVPFGEIPDLSLDDITVRGRPYIDKSLGYNVIRSDMGTLLRGVSLSTDGGDPYDRNNLLDVSDISLEQLQNMVTNYGFNTLHVYLEGDAEQNPDPVGINEELADHLVNITREAKMYLIITIGNNGENGAIHSMDKVLAFWDLYGNKYKDETHVIYEAHNEPVGGINAYWIDDDWNKQARMYEKIRQVAPDTMILLGSFMSFFGGTPAINGANDLADEFPGIWENAGFAFHAYWDLGQVETTIEAFKESDDYPALLCTEFWPGETKNGANEVFESHNIGWTQFEWLGGNDLELDRVKNYLDTYGTAWRPDNPNSTWPASGSPNIPIDQKIGLYSRVDKKFLGLDDQDRLIAGDESYDGVGSDEFIVVDAGDNGYIALLADNGKYLTVNRDSQGQPLVASAEKIGNWQKFKWLELPPTEDITGLVVRDIALRPWAGSGDLIGTIASTDGVGFGLTGPVGAGIKRGGANSYRMLTAYTNSVEPLQEIPPEPPGPFFGSPMPIPTNGNNNLPTSAPDNRLYASDYDIGGEGISYHDTGAVNLGEAYRPFEGVDVESSNEGHTAVGFFEEDEWLDFTVDVAQAGNYVITFRTASNGGGFISFESDCEKLTGNLPTPPTGWWDIWEDTTVDVTLKAGVQKLRVVSGGNMNLMNMDIQSGGEGGSNYGAGCEWVAPEPDDLKVQAEDWTTVVAAPEGTVNINAVATDSDLSLHVGNFDAGDYIEYAVELPETSCYQAEYRVASGTGSDGFELILDGATADIFKISPTGGFSSWVTFTRHYELTEGSQILRLEALGNSFNINWLAFNATNAVDCELSTAITVEAETYFNAIQLPNGEVRIEASKDEGGGLNVGFIDAGDWMEYEVEITQAGNYSISYRMASQSGSSSGVNLLKDGNLVDSVQVPNTGAWQNWQTVTGGNIPFEVGDYVLRFESPGGGLNLNWIKLMPTEDLATGNIGTGVDVNLDVGEVINFNDFYIKYDLIDLGDSLSTLVLDPADSTNTAVSNLKGADTESESGVQIASGIVTYPLSDKLTRLSMRVYSPAAGTSVRMRLEDSSNSAYSVETETLTTLAYAWETLVFDFSAPVAGTAELNTNYNYDTVSVFFNYLSSGNGETYYFDDITMLDEVAAPITLTQELLIGEWKLAPEPGSAGVGPLSGDMGWWQIDAGAVIDRDCLFDDRFIFGQDGSFTNQMGDQTWLEKWQGSDSEACGTPVAPHDGSDTASYALDTEAGTLTLTGVGAHLGLPKAGDGIELSRPEDASESITYRIMASTDDSMTIEVAYSGGFWTFKLVTLDYVPSESEEPVLDGDDSFIQAENWSSVIPSAQSDIGTQSTSDDGGGDNVGWISMGDWMEYTLNIDEAGNYQMNYRVASSGGSSPGFKILLNGTWIDQIVMPNTGGWQNWQTVQGRVVSLDAGQQTLRVEVESSGMNFNWLQLVASDEEADALPVVIPPITASELIGSWQLAPQASALSVISGGGGWSNDLAMVSIRDCLWDDIFSFYGNGEFANQMNGETWVETWQGVSQDSCDTPVAPHNGDSLSGFVFDENAMTITLNGPGAHLGIPKVITGAEISTPSDAPSSIVYEIIDSTSTTMTVKLGIPGGYWTFKLVKNSDFPDGPLPVSVVTVPELQADTQHVYVSEKTLSEGGDQVTVKLSYLVDDPTLTGVGFYLNFDSSVLSLDSVSGVASGAIASGSLNDEASGLVFAWSDPFGGSWPGTTEAELATVTFNILEGATGPTVLKMVKTSTPPGYEFDGQSYNVAISP
jgi:hypothetical protein